MRPKEDAEVAKPARSLREHSTGLRAVALALQAPSEAANEMFGKEAIACLGLCRGLLLLDLRLVCRGTPS